MFVNCPKTGSTPFGAANRGWHTGHIFGVIAGWPCPPRDPLHVGQGKDGRTDTHYYRKFAPNQSKSTHAHIRTHTHTILHTKFDGPREMIVWAVTATRSPDRISPGTKLMGELVYDNDLWWAIAKARAETAVAAATVTKALGPLVFVVIFSSCWLEKERFSTLGVSRETWKWRKDDKNVFWPKTVQI